VLLEHAGVREAVVAAREEQAGDKRLVAYLVAETKAEAEAETGTEQNAPTSSQLRSYLKERLPEYMIPASFVLLDSLPLTPNGKLDRRALPFPVLTPQELRRSFIAPRDTLELSLTQIWEEILGVQPIGVQDNFFELGGHSLLAVRLVSLIEKRLGKKLPLEMFFQGATVERLADIIRQKTRVSSESSLVEIQIGGSKQPFFFVHPVGGHVFCYIELARHLGPDQPFYGFQSRGLYAGQEPHTNIKEMAAHYIEAMQSIQPEEPYSLGGWSMGGIVAFEMAQQLQARGQKVNRLVLLDSSPLDENKSYLDVDDATLLVGFAQDLGLSLNHLPQLWKNLAQLENDEQLTHLLEEAKLAKILPLEIEISQMRSLLEVFKTNYHAILNYVPQIYPERITLFIASEELVKKSQDRTMGWSKLANRGVEIHLVPGNHYTILKPPNVQFLAEKILNEVGSALTV
jgi:thioesterase domain-containing protein/acyl carrier protein